MHSGQQPEFNFTSAPGPDGHHAWLEQRRQAMRQLARKIGLPLERKVEVWLRGEIRLTGILKLRDQRLFLPENRDPKLELIVDNVPFTPEEIISCVALD